MFILTDGFYWTDVHEWAKESPENWKQIFGDIPFNRFDLVYNNNCLDEHKYDLNTCPNCGYKLKDGGNKE